MPDRAEATRRPGDESRQLPQSVEVEEAVLGSVLIDPAAILRVAPFLHADDFFIVKNGWVWDVLLALHERREPIDFLTVCNELEARGQLVEIGGAAYVSHLINVVPTAIHAEGYGRIVAEKKARRDLLGVAGGFAQIAYSEWISDTDFISDASTLFKKFSENGHGLARDPWRCYTLADAYSPRPAVQEIVEGLFPLPSLSAVYSSPGRLKSFWLADLAVDVAAGLPTLPPLPGDEDCSRQTCQAPVLWFDFDNGTRRCHERFEALARARNLPETTPLFYYSMPSPWLDAADADAMDRLGKRVIDHAGCLVILDNLGSIIGKTDENSQQMAAVMSNFRRLTEATGAALVLIHHERKGGGVISRPGDKLRGHSTIEAALDLALLIEREEHSDLITIRSTKTRGVDVHPFGARFTCEHRPGTSELATARFFGAAIADTTSDHAVEDAILTALSESHPQNQTNLIGSVKGILPELGKNRIAAIANVMVQVGKLRAASGARGAWLYDLA